MGARPQDKIQRCGQALFLGVQFLLHPSMIVMTSPTELIQPLLVLTIRIRPAIMARTRSFPRQGRARSSVSMPRRRAVLSTA